MSQWYVAVNGQQSGPLSEQQLRLMAQRGQIGPDDLAWREGMAEWTAIQSVPELAGIWSGGGASPAAPWGPPAGRPAPAQPAYAQPTYAQPAYAQPAQAPPGAYPTTIPYEAPPITLGALDAGPFHRIGGSFNTGKGLWRGTVAASPRAFYMLKATRQQGSGGYMVGGLAGHLIAAAVRKDDDTRTCRATDLPAPIRAQLDPKNKHADKDVIILPKEAVGLVKIGGFSNSVRVMVGPEKFNLTCGLFGNGKLKRFLEGAGWTINQPLQPTAPPIHGVGYGRRPGDAPQPDAGKRTAKVVLLILLILIIIGVIVAMMASNMD